jgi:hypothetical protein
MEYETLMKLLADEGKLIEAGWVGYRMRVIHKDAPPVQLVECKRAFMMGAAHLLSSLMTVLDPNTPDGEPSKADMHKMSMIAEELDRFCAAQVKGPNG